MTRGMPYPIRMSEGFRTPTNLVRGIDLAGSVEAVGTRVTGFQPGDQVFGGTNGSFAEYTVTTPDRLARIPVTCTPDAPCAFRIRETRASAANPLRRMRRCSAVASHWRPSGSNGFSLQPDENFRSSVPFANGRTSTR